MGHALVALLEEVARRVCVLSCHVPNMLAKGVVPGGVLVVTIRNNLYVGPLVALYEAQKRKEGTPKKVRGMVGRRRKQALAR